MTRARTPWVIIQGDDDEIIEAFDRATLAEAGASADYLMPEPGTETLALEWSRIPFVFRRDFAIRIGGYPEFMAGGEDQILLQRMRQNGREGRYRASDVWTSVRKVNVPLASHPMSLVRNLFWYHMGLLLVLRVVSSPKRFMRGFVRDTRRFVAASLARPAGVLLAVAGLTAIVAGLSLTPIHYLLHRSPTSQDRSA